MRIEHTALYVQNLERARDFCETYFHAEAGKQYQNAVTGFCSYFLTFPDGGGRLELMTRPGLNKCTAAAPLSGWAHIAVSTGSREKVDAVTARLKADGYRVVSGPRTTGDGYYESCVLDAENNIWEICV